MSSVSRGSFRDQLQAGVDLANPDLETNLQGSGVSLDDVKGADLNHDGVVSGRKELDRLFEVVDGVDHDHRAATFDDAGPAGTAFGALKSARRDFGPDVSGAAAARVTADGANYAHDKAPTSPLANLSGNKDPGVSRPGWLKDQNKCNQFVGDVLTQAGVQAPTVRQDKGGVHYARAESWPSRADLFDRVTDPAQIRPGDVLVRDYPGTGESTAHVEVVTGTSPLRSTGAHSDGAYESENHFLDGATYNPATRSFTDTSGNEVYILRPKKAAE